MKNENKTVHSDIICTSLDGKPLRILKGSDAEEQRKDSLLNIARINFENNPNDLDNIIWYGRRLAYKTEYNKAIEVYTSGLEDFPKSPELYRHRGHRYISTRQFDMAIDDLLTAAQLAHGRDIEIEPDGIPNDLNKPLSNLHFNILYHLGLAYYLKHDFENAAKAYEDCLHYSVNDDLLVATADWLYMTYRRMGESEKAGFILESIPDSLTIIENDSYHKRIKMYKGQLQAKDLLSEENASSLDIATQGYGVGNWYLYNGDTTRAREIFNKVIETGNWPAFGYIAAEAETSP